MIGSTSLSVCQAMSIEEMRRTILPQLFDLLEMTSEIGFAWIWENGTVEIQVSESQEWERVYLTAQGHVFTTHTKKFEEPAPETKKVIKHCGDVASACNKGCGCGCLTDLGYFYCEPVPETGLHCNPKV